MWAGDSDFMVSCFCFVHCCCHSYSSLSAVRQITYWAIKAEAKDDIPQASLFNLFLLLFISAAYYMTVSINWFDLFLFINIIHALYILWLSLLEVVSLYY